MAAEAAQTVYEAANSKINGKVAVTKGIEESEREKRVENLGRVSHASGK